MRGGLGACARYLGERRPDCGLRSISVRLSSGGITCSEAIGSIARCGRSRRALWRWSRCLWRCGSRLGAWIVAKAAGIPSNAQGIGGFVNGARALVDPALVMVAAVAPLALIAGGLVLLFGGRRGMQIIGTALGVLLVLGSVTALIN